MVASIVVLISLIAGLGLGFIASPFSSPALTWVLVASVILGTSYSLPPLRLKRFPVLAALCIIAVRGSVVSKHPFLPLRVFRILARPSWNEI